MLLMDTKPSISTMMTATSTVNGFLTLNFSILSYRFFACAVRSTASALKRAVLHNSYYTQGLRGCKGTR